MAIGETIVGTLWASFAGICIEKLLDELLKVNISKRNWFEKMKLSFQNGINQKKSSSKESQDTSQPPTSPTSSTTLTNSSDNLLYNLSYLSSVIHPVIILRLLEHRIFTPLFKKKSILNNPSVSTNNNHSPIFTPNVGTTILASIPTLPRPETLTQKRNSLTKINRKTPSTSISGAATTSSQLAANNDPVLNPINPTDLSLFLHPTTTVNPNSTTRKWFWRNSEKNFQSNNPNDRNPLLQAIVENDPITSTGSVSANTTGVEKIKLLEKELLNLPSFQLSDSQNPLLPSPTCLSDDFPAHFHSTSPKVNGTSNREYSATNPRSKLDDEDCKYHTADD